MEKYNIMTDNHINNKSLFNSEDSLINIISILNFNL